VIDAQHWIGQYFRPSLPADATGWRVTRVQFHGRIEGLANANTLLQLRPANTDREPTDKVLEEVVLPESMLGDIAKWQDVEFSDVSGLPPGAGLCLVLKYGGGTGTSSAAVGYEASAGSARLTTGDAGANWNYDSDKSMYYCAYGTYATPGPPQTATRQYVTGVGIVLRAGKDPGPRVVTRAQTLNTPELLSGLWEADFDSDPMLDHNGDGEPDWVDQTGTFTLASLADGVWVDDSEMATFPDNDFVRLTTVNVRFRSISVGGGAVFRIHADQSGGTKIILGARLELQGDGTQTFTLLRNIDPATGIVVKRVTGLSNDFVELRLVIDPNLNTASVTVDGGHQGTYQYSTFVPAVDRHSAVILGDGGTAEFDHVSVRVAE
jgi:hypothetical protein